MKNILFLCLLLSLLSVSCKKDGTTATANKPSSVTQTPASQTKTLEAIPINYLEKIATDCDYTDFIFHDLPFAMSQSEKPAIQGNLNYISMEAQTTIPAGCKPIARQMWHSEGDIFLEFDVYYSDGCQFFAMVEKEKPVYACKMTAQGIAFYKQMIDRAMEARGKM